MNGLAGSIEEFESSCYCRQCIDNCLHFCLCAYIINTNTYPGCYKGHDLKRKMKDPSKCLDYERKIDLKEKILI